MSPSLNSQRLFRLRQASHGRRLVGIVIVVLLDPCGELGDVVSSIITKPICWLSWAKLEFVDLKIFRFKLIIWRMIFDKTL